MYFTENPVNFNDDYYGYKYFLCWQNTHGIYKAFKTQQECVEELEELIKEKIVWVGSHGFTVVDED